MAMSDDELLVGQEIDEDKKKEKIKPILLCGAALTELKTKHLLALKKL